VVVKVAESTVATTFAATTRWCWRWRWRDRTILAVQLFCCRPIRIRSWAVEDAVGAARKAADHRHGDTPNAVAIIIRKRILLCTAAKRGATKPETICSHLDVCGVHVEGHIIYWGTRTVVAVAAVTVTGIDHCVLCDRWQSHFITPLVCRISGGSGYRESVHAIEEHVVACRAGGQRQGDTPNAIAIIIRQRMHVFKAVVAVGAISSNCTLTVILLTLSIIVLWIIA